MGSLNHKVALVTGSSRGIGAAIARLFAQEGAKVAVHGRDTAALAAVRGDIERAGGTAMTIVADVTRFDEIEAMRCQIEQKLGPIEILVANANNQILLAWTENTAWNKGGRIGWQLFDAQNTPLGQPTYTEDLPANSTPAAFAKPDGSFVIIY